jgi:hypothetical protein
MTEIEDRGLSGVGALGRHLREVADGEHSGVARIIPPSILVATLRHLGTRFAVNSRVGTCDHEEGAHHAPVPRWCLS